MAQDNLLLYSKIKSGEYYKDALKWYNSVYVSPVAERTLFITITVICVAINLIIFNALYNFFPLVSKFPVAVPISDMSEEYSEIIKLNSYEDPNKSFSMYFIQEYVTLREGYDYTDLERRSTFIKSISTEEEFTKYSTLMNVNNPESPIIKYKNAGLVNVTILRHRLIEKLDASNMPIPSTYVAEVVFDRAETTYQGTKVERMQANIEFKFSGVRYDLEKKVFMPFDLAISSYTVIPYVEQRSQ